MTALLLLPVLLGAFRTGDTVEAIKFTGNRTFSSKLLVEVVTVRRGKTSSEGQLNRDVAALEKFYQDQGFFQVAAEKSAAKGRKRQVVTFHVVESTRTLVGSIDIVGNTAFTATVIAGQLSFHTGQPLISGQVQTGVEAIRTYYLNTGYPFAQVAVGVVRTGTSAAVTYTITEGARCRVSAVRVRGNSTVRASIITRAAAQRRLYATKLFARVGFYVLRPDSTRNEVVVRFDVIEQAYRGFALGAGVETPPNRFLLSVEWEHDNLFSLGHTLTLGTELSPALNGDYRVGVDGTYFVPYLVLTRIDFRTRPYFTLEKIDTVRLRDYGIETGLSRNVTPQFTIGLSNRLRFVTPSFAGITNSLALSGQFDNRNDIFDPSRGFYVQAVAEAAGGVLGGNNDLYRLTGEVRAFQAVGFGFVAAGRVLVGRVFPFGRIDRAPYYESFTLGGRSSLRGYGDKSLGPDSAPGFWRYGPAVLNGNLELRSPYFFKWVGVVVFADAGQVVYAFDLAALEYSAGAGLRVRTPIGPVRIDWGKRLRNPVAGDKGRFYLGLMHAF